MHEAGNAFTHVLIYVACLHSALAQYFPPQPEGLKILRSKFHDGVNITYKEVCNKYLCLQSLCWQPYIESLKPILCDYL